MHGDDRYALVVEMIMICFFFLQGIRRILRLVGVKYSSLDIRNLKQQTMVMVMVICHAVKY